jgi:hypothetical protein
MALTYRVVDLRTNIIDATGRIVEGVSSPEAAAREVLQMEVFRSGARKDLVARVYWQTMGSPTNMVRVYRQRSGD